MTTTIKERMAKIETNLENMNSKLDDHILEGRKDFKNIMDKLDNMHSSFAGKWVEKVSVGILISFIAGVLLLLIGRLS